MAAADSELPVMDVIHKHTTIQKFWLLTQFMLPLVVTQMVPDIGEQVLNRAITSLGNEEMAALLASFGLGYYLVRTLAAVMFECRHISIVLVHSMADYKKMLLLILLMSGTLSATILVICVTPAGVWLVGDLHKQPTEVTEMTLFIMLTLIPLPMLEAVANYHEGTLIKCKLTTYAGIAKFADFAFQVVFVIVFLFTPTRDVPIIIPISALYAGVIGRVILDVGFWFVLVRRQLPPTHATEKPTGLLRGFTFFLPLGLVRFVQVINRPIINLFVSRTLAATSVESATKALATLTAVYPTGRFLFSWLNDLRTIAPTFHKKTETHEKFDWKIIATYSLFCTLAVFILNLMIFVIPGPAYFIMNTIVGLTPELASMSLVPLKIFSGLCICVGLRASCSGYIIYLKKTAYLTPSAIIRFGFGLLALFTLPFAGVTGAVLGISTLLICFAVEAFSVVCAVLILKFVIPRIIAYRAKLKRQPPEGDHDNEELESLPA